MNIFQNGAPAAVDMGRVFRDAESGEIVTMYHLRNIFEGDDVLKDEYPSFGAYVANCQSHKGGFLEEVTGFRIVEGFASYTVTACRMTNADGIACRDWREIGTAETIDRAARIVKAWAT